MRCNVAIVHLYGQMILYDKSQMILYDKSPNFDRSPYFLLILLLIHCIINFNEAIRSFSYKKTKGLKFLCSTFSPRKLKLFSFSKLV